VRRNSLVLLSFGVLLETSLLIMWYLSDNLNRSSTSLEVYFAFPFAVYLATVMWVLRSKTPDCSAESIRLVILISVIAYVTFLLQKAPTLSGDIYRYIWDGKLINYGISPYQYPPDASQLVKLRDSNWYLVENNNIISPYPPLLELLNALTYLVSPTVFAFKLLTVVFAIFTVLMLPFFLKKMGYDPRLSAIFAWNPIFILEFGSSAHDDTIAVFLVCASLYLFVEKRMTLSACVMALAVVSKLFPLLMVPLFVRRWRIRATILLSAIVIVFYVPFALLGGSIFGPVSVYLFTSTPIFNGGAFAIFQNLFSWLGANNAITAARIVEYSIFVAVLAWFLWKAVRGNHDDVELMRYAAILLSVYLAFSSTIQPWYLSWIFVPFVVLMPTWSWIIFSGTIFLTYLTFTQTPIAPGYWAEITWVKVVEFGQLYLMIIYEIFSRRYFVPSNKKSYPEGLNVIEEAPSA